MINILFKVLPVRDKFWSQNQLPQSPSRKMHDNTVTCMPALTDLAYHYEAVQNSHYNLQVLLKEAASSTVFWELIDTH